MKAEYEKFEKGYHMISLLKGLFLPKMGGLFKMKGLYAFSDLCTSV